MSHMKSRYLLACLLAVSVIAGNAAGSILSAGEIRASGYAGSGPEIVEAEPVLTEEILTDMPGEETMTDMPEETSITDDGETVPAADPAELPEADPSMFIPAERVTPEDLEALKGEGITDEIAAETEEDIDVVKELLQLYPEDEGIYQMAAENGGLTDEAAADAAGAAADGTLRDDVTQEALENAGFMPDADETASAAEPFPAFRPLSFLISDVHADDGSVAGAEDRISGRAIQFEPSDDPSGAMARVSSFALIRKKDGSGDWDRPGTYTPAGDGYDWSGNDSSDGNGVVRTNDDVTYLMAYSTSLPERYMYNTIHGTRLYVSYTLPVPGEAAEFRTEAMPWMKGDGPDGGPVLTEEGGVQTLTGYRELPDREDPDGSYDVPGAGTLNCIVRVKEMVSGSTLTPSFRAWIARASSNAAAPEDALSCDTSALSAEVRVPAAPMWPLT